MDCSRAPSDVTIFQISLLQSSLPRDFSDCHKIPGCTDTLWYNLFSFSRGTWPATLQRPAGLDTPALVVPVDAKEDLPASASCAHFHIPSGNRQSLTWLL